MIILRFVLASLVFAASSAGWACSPPEQRDPSGFVRPEVTHLPKNARGLIFIQTSGTPRPDDFRVVSAQDKRSLILNVRKFKGLAWVRLELVNGFQPGARYEFRYLPAHGAWQYPDETSVAIDDAVASTEGTYEIELAPRPVHRVVVVPTSSGSCVEPKPAVVQEFTYSVPPSLMPYRDLLDYDASTVIVSRRAEFAPRPISLESLPAAPFLYARDTYSLGLGFGHQYNTRHNAVIAACGTRWPRIRLSGEVIFPEVDIRDHRTRVVEFDMNRNVEGQCAKLEALLHTVNLQAPEPALREVCGVYLAGSFSQPEQGLRNVELGAWERALSFFNGMSSTCNLVALAHLWHTGQYSTQPQTLDTLGKALKDGIRYTQPAEKDAAVHALAYLVDQMPQPTRATMARQLLAPVQPVLVEALVEPNPTRPDDIARLIIWSGSLPPELRLKVQKIARGKTRAASEAGAILGDPAARHAEGAGQRPNR